MGGRSPSSEEPPKAASKRKGARSVSSLTPQQLTRKRQNDREAQRAIRQRTRETIERLTRELEEAKALQDRDAQVADLMRRNKGLEDEITRLQTELRALRGGPPGHHGHAGAHHPGAASGSTLPSSRPAYPSPGELTPDPADHIPKLLSTCAGGALCGGGGGPGCGGGGGGVGETWTWFWADDRGMRLRLGYDENTQASSSGVSSRDFHSPVPDYSGAPTGYIPSPADASCDPLGYPAMVPTSMSSSASSPAASDYATGVLPAGARAPTSMPMDADHHGYEQYQHDPERELSSSYPRQHQVPQMQTQYLPGYPPYPGGVPYYNPAPM